MSLTRELALTILGLPNFATAGDIVIRYKHLALRCYPEVSKCSSAFQAFKLYTQAACSLIVTPEKAVDLTLIEMYGFFQYIFFGSSKIEVEEEYDSEDEDDCASSTTTNTTGAFGELTESNWVTSARELIEEEKREKSKAEKKRAKKKKRKEKKKQNKPDEKEVPNIEKISPTKEKKEIPKSDSEEELDATSAFVSVIAKKHKVVTAQSKENTASNFAVNRIPKEDPQSVILRSRELALRGNEMASMEHFSEAIQLFSEAIKLDSSDHRFFGNRSYCYEMLHQYDKALKDAERSLSKCPTWPKGHFRKGRALLGLRQFAAAEESFLQVLKYDKGCEFAIAELHHARVFQLMEKGFSKDKAKAAILSHGSVPEALKSLRNAEEIYMSDDESSPPRTPAKTQQPKQPYDIKQDPNNPEGHKSIWVGNVQADVSESKLISLFSKCGEIVSIKLNPSKYYAFINYKNKSAPGKAMRTYQGYELSGYNLFVRYPNTPGEVTLKTNSGSDSPKFFSAKKGKG